MLSKKEWKIVTLYTIAGFVICWFLYLSLSARHCRALGGAVDLWFGLPCNKTVITEIKL